MKNALSFGLLWFLATIILIIMAAALAILSPVLAWRASKSDPFDDPIHKQNQGGLNADLQKEVDP